MYTGVVDEIDRKIISDFNPPSTIDRNSLLVNPFRPSISTVFSGRWILIDRRYRPWSIDRDDKLVDWYRHSDRCWDHFSPLMGPWLFCRCVSGTISHRFWDHKSWSFFCWLLGKTRPGPKAKRLKRHTRKRKSAVGTQQAGWCAPGSLHTKSLEMVAVALLSSSSSVPSQRTFSAHSFRATWRPVSSRVSALVQVYMYV